MSTTEGATVIERYNLAPTLMLAMSDPAKALAAFHTILSELKVKIDTMEAPTTEGDKAEKVNPLEALYSKDEAGAIAALAFLRADGGIFDQIIEYCDDDPGRTFHMSNAIGMLTKYLSDEKAFFVSQISEAKPVNRSAKMELKSDFNALLSLFANVAGMAVASGMKVDDVKSETNVPGIVIIGSNKAPRSCFAGYKGTKSGDDTSVSGRYAKIYSLDWAIDGEAIEEGARIANIVRLIWTGADRIGKNAKSLTDLLDSVAPSWTDPQMKPITFETNGRTVTVSRSAD